MGKTGGTLAQARGASASNFPSFHWRSAAQKKFFASWDRFMVPYPWSCGLFLWGAPLWVPREADAAELEAKRVELETLLNRLTAEADEAVINRSSRR